jgi:rfaE bifunctional protein kinase chain/domain
MTTAVFEDLSQAQLEQLLARIGAVRVGILGDFCVDVYLFAERAPGEVSLESGLATHQVTRQATALGGAGNVAANVAAIGCARVESFGVIGRDPWGREVARLLLEAGVAVDGLLTQDENWDTTAYVKPHVGEDEQRRFDFGVFNRLNDPVAKALLEKLAARLPELDAVIVNQQVRQGVHSEFLRAQLAVLIAAHPEKVFIVDSRHFSEAYPGAILKINDHEAARLIGREYPVDALVLKADAHEAALQLAGRQGRPVFVTRGARGVVTAAGEKLTEVPGIQVLGKVDTVGAGDAMLAGVALGLAAGAEPAMAAALGNIVATVTVTKLRQTGTATSAEILAVGARPDFIYRPELAEDPRAARFVDSTEFEVVGDRLPPARITDVIFDHDGTISTLREGWEGIMEPMMVQAILGPNFASADDSLYHRVVDRVREYIDKSTGVQTLRQMQGLVKMVREFGQVPEELILDEHGYKRIYNDQLLDLVRGRVAKLRRGELNVADFTVKNAVRLLEALHGAGARLYLASGTDEADVIAEAEALGYAAVFEGRIFGAVGDVTKEAKRLVLDRILQKIGGADGLVAFGDGPVEIRETHQRGGYGVGVASDELRRFGGNVAKRARLIRAGSDLVIPDFSQLDALLAHLNVRP